MVRVISASFLIAVTSVSAAATAAFDGLTNTQLQNVRARLLDSAHASWEIGTAAQALLEFDTPALSVFGKSVPPPHGLNSTSPVLRSAGRVVDSKAAEDLTLMQDGAAGDPASIGIAVIMANLTEGGRTTKYADAAASQLSWLLHDVPRGPNGAISHRNEQFQAWADFVSMVPPFLAYYGAVTGDKGLLQQGYDQVKKYREILHIDNGDFKGCVHHVMYGDWTDPSVWATGQGWFAYGAIRVYQTLKLSSFSSSFKDQQADLIEWAEEIVDATWKHTESDGSFNNYLDQDNQFRDMSSTALMAATTFRLAVITGRRDNIDAATKAFKLVREKIDQDGWLLDVVNPYNFHTPGDHSPEGQAFVLQLQAAWSDYNTWNKQKNTISTVTKGQGTPDVDIGMGVSNVATKPDAGNEDFAVKGWVSLPKSS